MTGRFIGIDWGNTSFRAYLADGAGHIAATRHAADGIMTVSDGDFDAVLERHIGDWDVTLPVIISGMITSRQGWIECPYVPCPASLADVAGALCHHRSRRGRPIAFVPGLSTRSADGIPDVMRGEETQVFGSLAGGSDCFVAPGTHSRWITVADGRIVHFTTYMTGEVYAALKAHTILGRMMTADDMDDAAFARGVQSALLDPAGFLHRIFAARTLGLFGEIDGQHLASYLSGLLIGTEVAHAIRTSPRPLDCVVLGGEAIGHRYVEALQIAGVPVRLGDPHAVVAGLARLAGEAKLLT